MLDGAEKVRRISRAGFLILALGLVVVALAFGPARAAEVLFPQPAALKPNVQFWVNVFTEYSYRDFIIHDRTDVSRVYEVLHLPGSGVPSRSEVEWTNAYLKAKYTDILTRLGEGKPPADYEERAVAAMFHGQPPSAYADAVRNLRVQQGLRERFREGLLRSRYYRPTMERIFRATGIPVELVSLAEIESGFFPAARSGAGAVGIWQFTRATGRQYMRITRYHDDRLNPVRETEAAAQLLRRNYEVLGSWPLAITAYDYGTGGMARAADAYAHDYAEIFKNYDGPRFGFAAKNYYSEFLAALQVHEHEDKYFPGIDYDYAPPPVTPSTEIRRVSYVRHRVRHHHRWPMHHRHHRRKHLASR
ncbi:MAG: lytic transglycosylase domain-containing protein [Candidatus Binataceae bacterium]